MKILECVPNISEGRDTAVIDRICRHITENAAAQLLHRDTGFDANRTVLTLAGTPEEVFRAALLCMEKSFELIDMRTQTGAHPRLGAVDICPLVPVSGVTMWDAVLWANKLARRAAELYRIPVYLYEENAASPERKNLAFIRQGEYESLPQKLKELPPDFGPREMTPQTAKTGACIIGARNFLIAFNVNLNTQDVSAARQIAAVLREKNGGLPAVKAIGWHMPQYHCAQVSFNLTDYRRTNLHQVYETCKREARKRGLDAAGSELIGLVPLEAILETGRFYEGNAVLPEEQLVQAAIQGLGLHACTPFVPEEKILDYRLKHGGLL